MKSTASSTRNRTGSWSASRHAAPPWTKRKARPNAEGPSAVFRAPTLKTGHLSKLRFNRRLRSKRTDRAVERGQHGVCTRQAVWIETGGGRVSVDGRHVHHLSLQFRLPDVPLHGRQLRDQKI